MAYKNRTTCTLLLHHKHTRTRYTDRVPQKRASLAESNDGFQENISADSVLRVAAAAGRDRPRRRQLLPGRGHHLGRRPRQDPRQRPAPDAVPRQGLRLGVPVQEQLPVRPLRHADQARPRRLRRHRRHFLPVVAGFAARRDRLRVPGERERRAVHGAHERVQPGEGRPGAAVPHVVRPNQGLPHLLRPLEPHPHPVLRGRDADPGAQEPGGDDGGGVPPEPGDAGVRERVGRGGVGDAGRAGADGLVAGALHGVVPGVRGERVHVGGRGGVRQVQQPVDVPGAGHRRAGPAPVGAAELHDLQLLHGRLSVPAGRPARVHGQVEYMLRAVGFASDFQGACYRTCAWV